MGNPEAIKWKVDGVAKARAGDLRGAIGSLKQALAITPDDPNCWYEVALMMRRLGDFNGALESYAKALDHGIVTPEEVHLNRAVIYSDYLRDDRAAFKELDKALGLNESYAPALLNLGNLLEERGDSAAACATYRRLIDLKSDANLALEATARLADLSKPERADAPIYAELKAGVETVHLSPVSRANAGFALGRGLDRLGDYAAAFEAFDVANALAGENGPGYDPARTEGLIDGIIAAFNRGVASTVEPATARQSPIFILGMYRSGSTLCEQILASHSAVISGGELEFLPRIAVNRFQPFPQGIAKAHSVVFENAVNEYWSLVRTAFPDVDKGRLTDKRPDNFLLIGLIKALFPDARIVHTVRDPRDIGVSIYTQHINQQLRAYANDLSAIGHYIGQYRKLMDYWQGVYGDDIITFDYDAFVGDQEAKTRALLDGLGLAFEPECLAFHEVENTVKTASYWQVREPLYQRSSGRWRHYQDQLSPLIEALGEAGIALD